MNLFTSKMVVITRKASRFIDCLQVNETGRCNTTYDATYEEAKCLDRSAICRYIYWKKCKTDEKIITFDLQLKNSDHNSFCIALSSTVSHIRKDRSNQNVTCFQRNLF